MSSTGLDSVSARYGNTSEAFAKVQNGTFASRLPFRMPARCEFDMVPIAQAVSVDIAMKLD